ncbi:hypothetical protein BDP27DRAFT_1424532 [Rhodocollybia butyracea]|uniref:Yeast cell wall synthesis Kre9/Knh1-like N-terminal domain-containing protein n=1 Tax=Rhodocollybia butyracea TaxID=206335 RepID=A0A9P5PLY8_9AGAR|nr:hypothetical protein BDP27DRAFT_1424532 [Rhodocollybia butyracea]
MQFTLLISTIVALLTAFTSAQPVARNALDVWSPTVLSPTSTTVWTQGQQYNVTWDTSDAPSQISNGASVRLGVQHTLTDTVLADGFDLRQGWVTVTAPVVPSGSEYTIILFGDSGNESEEFSIIAAYLHL